jgi:enoyl-CoA hydratase/carnithine racemase
MPNSPQLRIVRKSEAYWRVTFDNPPLNLLNPDTINELHHMIGRIEDDTRLKVVVFDSADPDFFIAHYDMSRAGETPTRPEPSGLPRWIDFTTRLAKVSVVSVASIRGRARGVGSEFLLACDLRFASLEKAIFGQPEVAVGLIPGGGAVERLSILVGRARALEVLLGSDDFDASTAERYGWINRAVPDADLDAFVDNLARRVASFDRHALAEAKRLINRHGLPDPAELIATQEAFMQSIGWDGVRARLPKLAELGIGQRGDFEMQLGQHLGQLANAASPMAAPPAKDRPRRWAVSLSLMFEAAMGWRELRPYREGRSKPADPLPSSPISSEPEIAQRRASGRRPGGQSFLSSLSLMGASLMPAMRSGMARCSSTSRFSLP